MSVSELEHLFRPRRVAYVAPVGVRPAWVDLLERNLERFRAEESGPFLAVVALPQPAILGRLDALAAEGCRAAVIIGGGIGPFALGLEERRAVRARAQALGIRIVGPNRVGVMVPRHGLHAGSTGLMPDPGRLAFVTQSDTTATAVIDWAATRHIGFSAVVSMGADQEIELGDVIDALAQDGTTRAVLLHIKGVIDARRFMSAARAAARVKPLIVLKPRGHDADHDAVYDAALERAGALRVATMRELFTAAGACGTPAGTRRVGRGRLAIVANGLGPALQAQDALLARDGVLANLSGETRHKLARGLGPTASRAGPIDLGLEVDPGAFATAVRIALTDPGTDAVLACLAPGGPASPADYARALVEAGVHRGPGRRSLIAAWLGGGTTRHAREALGASEIPAYATPEEAVAAFMFRVAHERRQKILTEIPTSDPEGHAVDREAVRDAIARRDAPALLGAYGIPADSAAPREGLALHLAIRTDATFGPNIVFGLGGPARRMIATPAVALPPLSPTLARALIGRTEVGRLILERADPGLPDPDDLALILSRLGAIAAAEPEIVELDVDPLVLRGGRLVAAGAGFVAVPVDPTADPSARLAIRPYPIELEETLTADDGREVTLRPIRPEDAPSLVELFRRLDPEDRRLRLFAPVRELSAELAARLTQIDYDREMALVVEPLDAPGDLLAGARVTMNPDGTRAEFAVTVRSDQKRRGLGLLCLGRCVEHARQRGVLEVYGEILRENLPMQGLARELGFRIVPQPHEPEIVRAVLATVPGDRAAEAAQS